MKRIGIISDTHLRAGSTRVIPARVFELFENCDLILHGGDVTDQSVLDALHVLAPVVVVRGNNDFGDLRELPLSLRVEIEDVVIGLAHGDEPAFGQKVKKLEAAPGNRQTAANAISHFQFEIAKPRRMRFHIFSLMVMWTALSLVTRIVRCF